jgi:hypothetical protein
MKAMRRVGVLTIVLAAAITGACGGTEDPGSSPTAPSSTPSTPSTPPPAPPQASCVPANLRVVSIQGTVVTLRWDSVSGATEYVVLVGSTSGSSDQLSTNTTNNDYTWTAKKGPQYARVQAKCNGSFGGSSNEVGYTVP